MAGPQSFFMGPTAPSGEIVLGAIWIDTSTTPNQVKYCLDNTVVPEVWAAYNQSALKPGSDIYIQANSCVVAQDAYYVPSGSTLYIGNYGCLLVF